MNPSETQPCEYCTHVRVKGEQPNALRWYCIVHDQKTNPWETCPRWDREPGADDDKGEANGEA